MLTFERTCRRGENIISKAVQDGFLIRAGGRAVTDVSCDFKERLQAFSLFCFCFPIYRGWNFILEDLLFFYSTFWWGGVTRAFWHPCSRMQSIRRERRDCRSFHSQAPSPFITPLFNQLAVTEPSTQPLLMLIKSHLPSIWPLYCRCQRAELVSTTGWSNWVLMNACKRKRAIGQNLGLVYSRLSTFKQWTSFVFCQIITSQ